ncbi:helix-turn-helix domain-containing protein [Paenibacillus albus]|uniref:XRE family transcriptional regulator n=1 Tax=Paenibacillus albus TaxID=2495582 RepID=A0A3S9ACE1_9BACL|nr:helix-turn-helix transcriptional regulator [Paenibacillus albus]AZN43384.1 XRE family transcriptional regulator [Paenibacillus albus]
MMDTAKPIGEMLKACRERANLSQRELAELLHVDRSVVAKVEAGIVKQPSYALVKEWARLTEAQEIVGMDISGGRDGWTKLRKLEAMFGQVKSAMEMVHFFKRKKERA